MFSTGLLIKDVHLFFTFILIYSIETHISQFVGKPTMYKNIKINEKYGRVKGCSLSQYLISCFTYLLNFISECTTISSSFGTWDSDLNI